MKSGKRMFTRTLVGAAVFAALGFAGSAVAQQTVKIGLLATLEGPFAAGGQDGMRGAELAIKQRNGMVAGKKIELVKASSDAKPDVAVNAHPQARRAGQGARSWSGRCPAARASR